VVDSRLLGSRGLGSGSEALGKSVWAQGFGATSTQDMRDGAAGYDADTYGLAAGVEGKFFNEYTKVGTALSYANTSVDSKNATTTQTDIDSYQLTLYGDYAFGQGTFVEGSASYALNSIESTRNNVGGTSGLTAKADYDAQTYGARAAVGHLIATDSGVNITPKALVEYVSFNPDTYTETGAGTANLTIDSGNAEQLNLGVSVELSKNFRTEEGALFVPRVNVGYKHDTMNDAVASIANFQTGGTFTTNGLKPDADTTSAGLGLDYYSTGNMQVTFDYRYESKNEYDSHTGVARASIRF
jgi:outer membrane autotransporter protein